MSALKFINSLYQQKSSTKQSLHNNQNLGHTMYQKLFQIQWTNKCKQFREHCQHFVSHSFNALRTLLTKHPAKRNYKEPTHLETSSKNILSKTKTVNPETKFQHKIKIGNILCPEFWERTPKYLTWKSEKKSKRAWGFDTIPSSTNSSCLGSVIWAPATHRNSKQVVSRNIFK